MKNVLTKQNPPIRNVSWTEKRKQNVGQKN